MRALCGAIITAGALIGLGLTAIGFGNRYQGVLLDRDAQGHVTLLGWQDIDRPLVCILVLLSVMALIGLGIAFVGLAYHHHRRFHEMLHRTTGGAPREQLPV
jgi:hypothetical protein